jgi:hypothetical protein
LEAVLPYTDRRLTPLWIVAIFVSLAETVLGVLVTQTVEFVQLLLATFAIAFPSGVALAFFLTLWYKADKLYAPWEYPSREMLEAFRQDKVKPMVETEKLHNNLREAVSKEVPDRQKVEAVISSIESQFLTIDTKPLLGEQGDSWTAPYDQFPSVQSLLNSIYFAIPRGLIKPFTYGRAWLLRDAQSGKTFNDLGSRSNIVRRMGAPSDERRLSEVGIKPGMRLEVTPA